MSEPKTVGDLIDAMFGALEANDMKGLAYWLGYHDGFVGHPADQKYLKNDPEYQMGLSDGLGDAENRH